MRSGGSANASRTGRGAGLEHAFDAAFAAELALREKQIQQSYRPVIGVHKWFARRPGTLFRALLLSEYGKGPLASSFFRAHRLSGVIADPFMGGGTPVYEANRLGFHVVGCDINPMACWIVRQSLACIDLDEFAAEAEAVAADVEREIGELYRTACARCGALAHVKYFLWVKTAPCPHCGQETDLFPGHRLAEAERHPRHVLVCAHCGELNEYDSPPTRSRPAPCGACGRAVHVEGNVSRRSASCRACGGMFSIARFEAPPEHRMWAIEYHCPACYGAHEGRQFKRPDRFDLDRFAAAERRLARAGRDLPIPNDEIPPGDETDRLRRWGYKAYRELFGVRQQLGLGLLLRRIERVRSTATRHALLTVFSDTLRYQNLLCRYDTYALKCQDVFSLHGFPLGLLPCENNLLGIRGVGSGSFHHFVAKFVRAKRYCRAPFETRKLGRRKQIVPVNGETIEAELVEGVPRSPTHKQAWLVNGPSQHAPLPGRSLDGVFTDPPYFDNVQYAELIDFCFAWLRQALGREHAFDRASTRSPDELTGNATLGRGLDHFTAGLSSVFRHFARALKPGAPFVFTYHHNDAGAYLPIVLAILDAGLDCTATLPAPAEMTASRHIAGTSSSVLDSVFVCRKPCSPQRARAQPGPAALDARTACEAALRRDARALRAAGVRVSSGDLRCLLAGHVARVAASALRPAWNRRAPLARRMRVAQACLERTAGLVDAGVIGEIAGAARAARPRPQRGCARITP